MGLLKLNIIIMSIVAKSSW